MKSIISPVRLADGRLLRYEKRNALGQDEWRAADGLWVIIERDAQYGSHVSVSHRGLAPLPTDVALVRAALFDDCTKLIEKSLALSGVVHLIELKGKLN